MLLPGELKKIQELITFLRQELSSRPETMLPSQQEHVAASIVGLGVNDKFDEWQRDYPVLEKIFALAVDLERSNVASEADISDYWKTISHLVDELEKQIGQS